MKANIVINKSQIALNNVEVERIGAYAVSFYLNKEMENRLVFQMLTELDASIAQLSDSVYVSISKKDVTIEFI